MNFLKVFEDVFRWLLWVVLKFLLYICDQLYMAVKSIAYFDLMGERTVWVYYIGFMSAFLVLFIVFRLSKRYLKTLVDEEEAEHFKPDKIILKIAAIGFLIAVLPFLLKTFGSLLSQLVNMIENIFSVETNEFSSILIKSADIGADNYQSIDGWSITDKTSGGDYAHIPSLNTFLCLFIATLFSFYLILLIGIQLGGRLLSIVMKLIIAPYSFSSIVDERNESFTKWWQLFIADFLATYVQMILLLVGTSLILGLDFKAGNAFASGLAKDIALIGALFGVLNAPTGISQIIGSDIGVSTALQSMQTTMMAMGITSSAGRFLGNAATFAGAGATYLAGRSLGGASMKSILNNTIPGTKTLSGSIQNSGGGSGVGDGMASGGSSDLNLSMSDSPSIQPSYISSSRGGATGIEGASGTVESALANTNVARIVSNYAQSGGNKTIRTAARFASWGSNRLYGASMNRLQKGFNNHNYQANRFNNMNRNPAMYNFTQPASFNNDVSDNNSFN